jgi:hypothetical protein
MRGLQGPSNRYRFLQFLAAGGVLASIPVTGSAQGVVTVTAGYRGPAGRIDPSRLGGLGGTDRASGGPMLGVKVDVFRRGWLALGPELSWALRMTASDSGAYPIAGQVCVDPQGNMTTCASQRVVYGEGTGQIGLAVNMGPRHRRTAPFGELAAGYYKTFPKGREDIWDPNGVHLTNNSGTLTPDNQGIYSRFGLGIETKPWRRGPALSVSARYRWARVAADRRGLTENPLDRSGFEVVLGVRL